ncbi:hypothetical protein [Oceanotoga teriensis]|uniref:DUF4878 domain-containing protein n=1 Tax=Oceanotoga teriensis TaxID=515440 RepID=A0AA45HHU1_9BACT|nr:hypothetical protein [Oceanotoga teriensis]MDO7976526.1 hypothetical protein [Oceanotoga teriensis]PWJ87884.1 hypothetical protein C7380_12114 [Oceanotoga teriensis]
MKKSIFVILVLTLGILFVSCTKPAESESSAAEKQFNNVIKDLQNKLPGSEFCDKYVYMENLTEEEKNTGKNELSLILGFLYSTSDIKSYKVENIKISSKPADAPAKIEKIATANITITLESKTDPVETETETSEENLIYINGKWYGVYLYKEGTEVKSYPEMS